jgi:hypothetical protein
MPEHAVGGRVDHAHAAAAELVIEEVAADDLHRWRQP